MSSWSRIQCQRTALWISSNSAGLWTATDDTSDRGRFCSWRWITRLIVSRCNCITVQRSISSSTTVSAVSGTVSTTRTTTAAVQALSAWCETRRVDMYFLPAHTSSERARERWATKIHMWQIETFTSDWFYHNYTSTNQHSLTQVYINCHLLKRRKKLRCISLAFVTFFTAKRERDHLSFTWVCRWPIESCAAERDSISGSSMKKKKKTEKKKKRRRRRKARDKLNYIHQKKACIWFWITVTLCTKGRSLFIYCSLHHSFTRSILSIKSNSYFSPFVRESFFPLSQTTILRRLNDDETVTPAAPVSHSVWVNVTQVIICSSWDHSCEGLQCTRLTNSQQSGRFVLSQVHCQKENEWNVICWFFLTYYTSANRAIVTFIETRCTRCCAAETVTRVAVCLTQVTR